jgi:hypothetical protein
MKQILGMTAAASMLWLGAATGQQVPKKSTAATTARHTPLRRTAPAKKSTSTSSKKGASKKSATTWRNRQLAPSAERYREIQSALVARGYLSPEQATGTWNQTSIDALKRFQAEQNLESSGKINSLSLIALGLGPKRETSTVPPPPAQPGQ